MSPDQTTPVPDRKSYCFMGNHRADRRGPRRRSKSTAPVAAPVLTTGGGRRKASRHTGTRGPLFRGLPSVPVLVGLAALSASVGGAVTAASC